MIAAFPIDWERARALMPAGDVHPFRMLKRGLLVVPVIDYRKTDIGAYVEYSLAIACTKGAGPAPRLLPGMSQRLFGTGQYVFDLPVSTEVSVKGGKGLWGMPKHQANLDFLIGSHWISSQYDLDGKMVSRFDVRRPKSTWLPISMRAANYCVFRGMMMKSLIHFRGKVGFHLLRPGSARNPVFAAYIPEVRGVLDDYFECWFVTPENEPTGPISEGLEATYPLGYGLDWLPPPQRDPNFKLNGD